jgi:hypothetical protein
VPALPETLQALQAVQAVLAQQTPSVHIPLRHSALLEQLDPSAFRPVQMPLWQAVAPTQSVSRAHAVKQAVGPQTKFPGQATDVCAHVPAPLQALTTLVDPEQVVTPQLVPALVFRQPPVPSHVPSNPHGGLAAQR